MYMYMCIYIYIYVLKIYITPPEKNNDPLNIFGIARP